MSARENTFINNFQFFFFLNIIISSFNYPIHLRSQVYVINLMITEMKTEIVNSIANEPIYQLEHYKNLYFAHKKNNKTFLILVSTIIICLIAVLVNIM